MKKILSSIVASIAVLSTVLVSAPTASAKAVMLTPMFFCEGIRHVDKETYKNFIGNHSLGMNEYRNMDELVKHVLAFPNDKDALQLLRYLRSKHDYTSTRWTKQVKLGQVTFCGQISNNW